MAIYIEKMIANAGSKYALGMMIAKRAKEITTGAKLFTADISGKPDTIAMREIADGKLRLVYKPKAEKPVVAAEPVI